MEQTSTLAESLLDDLNDLSDSDEDQQERNQDDDGNNQDADGDETMLGNDETSVVENSAVGTASSSRFLSNPVLQNHLSYIETLDTNNTFLRQTKKEKEEEEHRLVVSSNRYLAMLADELAKAHGELAMAYKPKFPELEELLPNFIQYKNAVRVIGNEMDLTKVNDELNAILNSNQIITVSVAGSTTSGRPLTEDELKRVDAAASYIEQLLEVETKLTRFVENSMEALAPSICALIGPSTAARLIGLVGGLAELTKIPACNLQVIGQVKQNSTSRAGMSNASTKQHIGIVAECDLVQSMPRQLQKKALKLVAAKLALAARFDFVNVDTGRPRSDETGVQFRQALKDKFEKLQEPDKAQVLKALPKPDLTVKKRRGGKRMRRWKERFEETAMMKQANTRAFSSQQGEYGDDAMGMTMGLLDTADSGGAIRKVSEKRKMRQANTKASRKRAMTLAQQAKNKDGLASSVVFTQSSSMELVNPDANKNRVREANKKWFKENAGFQSALPKKGG
eukprot:scaffold9191_cov114-Cylindrotheca_fusiformis.AAC.26